MSVLVTDAIVLHAANYLESSRILKLATRDAGVQTVVARGARSSKKRFGSAVDLFAEGQAQVQWKPGRDLQSLTGFDVTVSRPALGTDLTRFTAASAIAESVLRVVHDEAAPRVYELLADGLNRLAAASVGDSVSTALATLWQIVGEVGFRPTIDACVECHSALPEGAEVRFHHRLGGALCGNCEALLPGGRLLPPEAREALRGLLEGTAVPLAPTAARAHQRLLREFLSQHIGDNRPLKAFAVWETRAW